MGGLRLARAARERQRPARRGQAFDTARALKEPKPRVILFDTLMGKGVPFLEQREKNHFIRVDPPEWQQALEILDQNQPTAHPKEPGMNSAVAEKKPRLTTSAMIASIASEGQRVKAAPFGKALVEYAASRPRSGGPDRGPGEVHRPASVRAGLPDRFFQMGMAEQLLMGAAGGMAKEGLVPFATTYAVFGTRRAYDFIHQVIAEENLNVKICCALPGLTTGYGPSHQATEDIAMMRGIPGLTIVDPCDALDIEQAVPQIAAHKGPVYMRCCVATCRWCSTRCRAIASSWARPRCCARARTCW
jgi:transketolase